MRYRVWTINGNETATCMTGWMTRGQCKKMILGRWGHWPPYAFISAAASERTFKFFHKV